MRVCHEVCYAVGATRLVGAVACLPPLVEDACHLLRIRTLVVRQRHIAPVAVGECCRSGIIEKSVVEGVVEHALHIPRCKLLILAEVVESWRDRHPLYSLHEDSVEAEVCPVAHTVTGEVGVIRRRHRLLHTVIVISCRELRVVYVVAFLVVAVGLCVERRHVPGVVLMSVEPVFCCSACLADPSEESCITHSIVLECHTEQIHTAPSLHSLRCRFLSVAVTVAQASCKGVS